LKSLLAKNSGGIVPPFLDERKLSALPMSAEGAYSVRQQLESLVAEMVEKGILFEDARREFEKRFIARVLLRHRGNLSRAAKDLRIHRNTLGRKIEEYKL